MKKYNTELAQTTKALNNLDIKEISKTSHFCDRKRLVKPFE